MYNGAKIHVDTKWSEGRPVHDTFAFVRNAHSLLHCQCAITIYSRAISSASDNSGRNGTTSATFKSGRRREILVRHRLCCSCRRLIYRWWDFGSMVCRWPRRIILHAISSLISISVSWLERIIVMPPIRHPTMVCKRFFALAYAPLSVVIASGEETDYDDEEEANDCVADGHPCLQSS